jgi:hypothetical protein
VVRAVFPIDRAARGGAAALDRGGGADPATIVHVYAAIWVKGTVRAMTRGTVTELGAANHALWHREVTK